MVRFLSFSLSSVFILCDFLVMRENEFQLLKEKAGMHNTLADILTLVGCKFSHLDYIVSLQSVLSLVYHLQFDGFRDLTRDLCFLLFAMSSSSEFSEHAQLIH